jgi:hypothetical protein
MQSTQSTSPHLDPGYRFERRWLALPEDPLPRDRINQLIGQLAAVQRKLGRYGVEIEVLFEGYELDPEWVGWLLEDREAVMAAFCGVTVDQYRAFWGHDWQCQATTTRGVRCYNRVIAFTVYELDGLPEASCPPQFDPKDREACYCRVHLKGM